ncbi:MAG: 50S ribosomal protein L11 methyltransferase [Egibacteraceae bacterium]
MAEYEPEQVWLPVSESILDWDKDFHNLLLNDHIRMVAFKAAIDETVKPGMVVLDLGTGTGILAQWALQAGAVRVYGIDLDETILATAVERIAAAGCGDRFHAIHSLSFEAEIPERVDVIVSEIMGNLADNEDFIRILMDARRRFLNDGGSMLPDRVASYLVPVAAKKAHDQVKGGEYCGGKNSRSLDDALRRRGVESRFDCYYDVILPKSTYLAAPRMTRLYNLGSDNTATYRVSRTYPVGRGGIFTGFKGYFIARLSQTVTLDISGDSINDRTTSDSWKHCYLPIEEPVEVRQHDRIKLVFSRTYPHHREELFRQRYRWEGQVMRGSTAIACFGQDTGGYS